MKYNEQELKDSKKAYEKSWRLWYVLNGKNKETMDNVEGITWLTFGFLAFIAFCFLGYGSVTDSERFIEALLMSGAVLSPAAVFSVIRHTGRAIVKNIMNDDKERGRLYEQYQAEIDHMISVYGKAIEKIVVIAKSNDNDITKQIAQLDQDITKEEEKINLSLAQDKELTKVLDNYFEKDLSRRLSAKEMQKLITVFQKLGKKR